MPTKRILYSTFACAAFQLTAFSQLDSRATVSAQTGAKVRNPIAGEGLRRTAVR